MLGKMSDYGIGNTPLVELPAIHGNRIFIKLEKENYLGSSKTRTGYQILHDLPPEADGRILIESSSGNLGLSLGVFSKMIGREFLCLIDKTCTQAKVDKLEEAGIAYMMVEQEFGYDIRTSRMRKAQSMMDSGKYFWVNQYNNEACIRAHQLSTGPEIWEQTQQTVTHCVCAMGSGGTVVGIGRYLKSQNSEIKMCGVEPFGSTIYGTQCAPHINAGSGQTGKPGNIRNNPDIVDIPYTIPDQESIAYAQMLHYTYGLDVGITSGMAYAGAVRIAQENQGATIVCVAPDGRSAYGEYLY